MAKVKRSLKVTITLSEPEVKVLFEAIPLVIQKARNVSGDKKAILQGVYNSLYAVVFNKSKPQDDEFMDDDNGDQQEYDPEGEGEEEEGSAIPNIPTTWHEINSLSKDEALELAGYLGLPSASKTTLANHLGIDIPTIGNRPKNLAFEDPRKKLRTKPGKLTRCTVEQGVRDMEMP